MLHGKTRYKWPFSIAFCMFTRPGTLPFHNVLYEPVITGACSTGEFLWDHPAGKHTNIAGENHLFFIGKSTFSMGHFNSLLYVYQRV